MPFKISMDILLLLVKNSVIKNIVFDQKQNNYKIAIYRKTLLLIVKRNLMFPLKHHYFIVNSIQHLNLIVMNLIFIIIQNYINNFGWLNDKFVSNIDTLY